MSKSCYTDPMTKPAARPAPATLPIEADERDRDQVDAFIARNREALNESIALSRREAAEGQTSPRTIEDLIADGRRRHRL
ncbi:MAG: hypothetical protein ABIO39_14420 [Caulobacteraceae bacterium]